MSDSTSPNHDVATIRMAKAQKVLRHVGQRAVREVVVLMSPDVSYQVHGHGSFAGTFSGREEVAHHLLAMAEATEETFDPAQYEDWLIGESHVAALVRVHANARGKRFSGKTLFLFRFDTDDAIDELAVYFDDEDAIARFVDQ